MPDGFYLITASMASARNFAVTVLIAAFFDGA